MRRGVVTAGNAKPAVLMVRLRADGEIRGGTARGLTPMGVYRRHDGLWATRPKKWGIGPNLTAFPSCLTHGPDAWANHRRPGS